MPFLQGFCLIMFFLTLHYFVYTSWFMILWFLWDFCVFNMCVSVSTYVSRVFLLPALPSVCLLFGLCVFVFYFVLLLLLLFIFLDTYLFYNDREKVRIWIWVVGEIDRISEDVGGTLISISCMTIYYVVWMHKYYINIIIQSDVHDPGYLGWGFDEK